MAVGSSIASFLTSALDKCEGLASRPGRFTPRERATVTRSGRGGEDKNFPGIESPIIQPSYVKYDSVPMCEDFGEGEDD
jgi:hypothetical protein